MRRNSSLKALFDEEDTFTFCGMDMIGLHVHLWLLDATQRRFHLNINTTTIKLNTELPWDSRKCFSPRADCSIEPLIRERRPRMPLCSAGVCAFMCLLPWLKPST